MLCHVICCYAAVTLSNDNSLLIASDLMRILFIAKVILLTKLCEKDGLFNVVRDD